MPKVVDHEARRRELAAAVWRVIAARGPEAVTIRDVAAEAGWSSGALRHYLPTREELLVFAFRLAGERATERIVAAGDAPIARILEEAMPLDEERRQEALIWFAFVGLAPSAPGARRRARPHVSGHRRPAGGAHRRAATRPPRCSPPSTGSRSRHWRCRPS